MKGDQPFLARRLAVLRAPFLAVLRFAFFGALRFAAFFGAFFAAFLRRKADLAFFTWALVLQEATAVPPTWVIVQPLTFGRAFLLLRFTLIPFFSHWVEPPGGDAST